MVRPCQNLAFFRYRLPRQLDASASCLPSRLASAIVLPVFSIRRSVFPPVLFHCPILPSLLLSPSHPSSNGDALMQYEDEKATFSPPLVQTLSVLVTSSVRQGGGTLRFTALSWEWRSLQTGGRRVFSASFDTEMGIGKFDLFALFSFFFLVFHCPPLDL